MRHAAIAILCFGCQAGDGPAKAVAPPIAPTPAAAPDAQPAPSTLSLTMPTAPIGPAASTVTHDLPASAIASLVGCWRYDTERWTFKADGDHGLVVVRDIGDQTYAGRARIPAQVSYDPKTTTFGFGAAGRIHGLMMVFQIKHATLENAVYTSHDGHSYTWTGNTWTLRRC